MIKRTLNSPFFVGGMVVLAVIYMIFQYFNLTGEDSGFAVNAIKESAIKITKGTLLDFKSKKVESQVRPLGAMGIGNHIDWAAIFIMPTSKDPFIETKVEGIADIMATNPYKKGTVKKKAIKIPVLSGVVVGVKGSSAIINDVLVMEGAIIDGFTVINIAPLQVMLKQVSTKKQFQLRLK